MAMLKIEKSYDQLKSIQSQLIQSEKMASLGELTAGIAHEVRGEGSEFLITLSIGAEPSF